MMGKPTKDDAMIFFEYYKLWNTPLDTEAYEFFAKVSDQPNDFETVHRAAPRGSREASYLERILCSFEQAGVLMKNGLMHPDLFFDAWSSAARTWKRLGPYVVGLREQGKAPRLFENVELLAKREEEWLKESRR
jgi:hypothetical protein